MQRAAPMRVLTTLVLIASSSVAAADTGTLPGGMTVTFPRLWIHENNSGDLVQPSNQNEVTWHYFNLAHCQCSKSFVNGGTNGFNEGT